MRRLLIFLSGARADIIKQYPSERIRFEGLGASILVVGVLNFVSMAYALTLALAVNVSLAVTLALIWAVIIMNLDRWLVLSVRAGNVRGLQVAVPRLLLSLLLGITLSTPLVLQIFKPEINAQIAVMKQTSARTFQKALADSTTAKEIARLERAVGNYQQVIASRGRAQIVLAVDPVSQALEKQLSQAEAAEKAAFQQLNCQVYGGPNCEAGSGALAQAAAHRYVAAQNQVTKVRNEIAARNELLTSPSRAAQQARLTQAQSSLLVTQVQLSKDQAAQQTLEHAFYAANQSDNGLLRRLQALDQLSSSSATINAARLVLFIFFLVIQCLPVTVKLMQRPGNYERILDLARQRELKEARYHYGSVGPTTLEQAWDREPAAVEPPPPTGNSANPDQDLEDRALRGMQDMRSAGAQDQAHHSPAS
jgi:Domain of unknown function (DUF4407)